ncbi:MAG: hypothetical protein AB1Z98_09120 [Nannocystaceae bacterium]
MSDADRPLVYCETNWIIDLAFPHREHHRAAKALLDASNRGLCSLHVPLAALLEARRPLKKVKDDLVNDLTTLRDRLVAAARNGVPELMPIHEALDSEALRRYVEREPPSILPEGLP